MRVLVLGMVVRGLPPPFPRPSKRRKQMRVSRKEHHRPPQVPVSSRIQYACQGRPSPRYFRRIPPIIGPPFTLTLSERGALPVSAQRIASSSFSRHPQPCVVHVEACVRLVYFAHRCLLDEADEHTACTQIMHHAAATRNSLIPIEGAIVPTLPNVDDKLLPYSSSIIGGCFVVHYLRLAIAGT